MTLFIGYDEHESLLLLTQWLRNIHPRPSVPGIPRLVEELKTVDEWRRLHKFDAKQLHSQHKPQRVEASSPKSETDDKQSNEEGDDDLDCEYETLSDWAESMLQGNTKVSMDDWKKVFEQETDLKVYYEELYGYHEEKKLVLVYEWIKYSCDQGSGAIESFVLMDLAVSIAKCHEQTKLWATKHVPSDPEQREELNAMFRTCRLLVSCIQVKW